MLRVDSGYVIVYLQIGNISMYHWSYETKKLVRYGDSAVTDGARGRLGPYVDKGGADLRNMEIHYFTCKAKDSIILLSDAIDANFRMKIVEIEGLILYRTCFL